MKYEKLSWKSTDFDQKSWSFTFQRLSKGIPRIHNLLLQALINTFCSNLDATNVFSHFIHFSYEKCTFCYSFNHTVKIFIQRIYSFKETRKLFIQRIYSFKKNPKLFIQKIHSFKKIQNYSLKKIFIQMKNGLSPRATWSCQHY